MLSVLLLITETVPLMVSLQQMISESGILIMIFFYGHDLFSSANSLLSNSTSYGYNSETFSTSLYKHISMYI